MRVNLATAKGERGVIREARLWSLCLKTYCQNGMTRGKFGQWGKEMYLIVEAGKSRRPEMP
jgi:hypothetical protein